ncbi:MAG: hypothetical protein ACUVSK_04210 [Desulfotomaculales bacterium]
MLVGFNSRRNTFTIAREVYRKINGREHWTDTLEATSKFAAF